MFDKIAIAIKKKHLEELCEIVDEKLQKEGNGYFLSAHYTIDFC